jgi:toxin-antitoxin system PIN domain toxin
MILPDVNVLVYAFRRDVPQHAICSRWLNRVLADDASFGISPLTLSAVTRVTTDHRIYRNPSSLAEVFALSDHLVAQPHCRIVEPGERHWDIFRRLCVETDTTGRRVSDAWYAALAIEWGCEWITFDRDYARFPGLKWSVPAAA